MDSALAIAAVTAALKDLLNNGLINYSNKVGEVTVNVLPPDRIGAGDDERCQINLFMYRVSPHTSLGRGEKAAATKPDGERKRTPRLALELWYLVTAYGREPYQAEILLGRAMQLLLENSVLRSEQIGAAVDLLKHPHSSKPGKAGKEAIGGLEEIRITPQFLSFEEMSKLWSALQARYRPSVTYQVSAVTLTGSQ